MRGDYLAAYARHTDMRAAQDPQKAIGGMWDEIGLLQFDFLVERGLQPSHAFLDIGCGTLRGGRHFIRYLNAGHYTGTDISSGALEAGPRLIEKEGLAAKRPRLIVTRDLSFREFHGETFDSVLASVRAHASTKRAHQRMLPAHRCGDG
jgi:SAM-dependent methyltransferase